MGAGRSRSNLKQCSCISNNSKRNGQSYHAELCNHPNKYVLTRIPSMGANGMCACNAVLTDCQYNLDPLTAEEQLDEVERMYREKNQTRTAAAKRQCADNTTTMPTICCNCACICGNGDGGGTTLAPDQIERRNGLQNIDRCNGGCQCVLCCENVRDTRMGGLTEAEAIADAIREYCCKERERAGNGGRSASCKCCACKQPHATEEVATRGQVIEEDEDYEDDEVADADVDEEEEVEIVKHKRVVKEELVIEEKIQSKMREDELTEEEEIEYIEPAPRERRRSQDSAAVSPEQKHAKSCKCCVCKKKAKQDKDLDSDSDENIISLEDIELEVQTDVISTQRDQFDKPTSPSSKRNSQASSAKRNRCCTCEKATTTDFLQETEVLMKNTNLVTESSEELKPMRAKPTKTQPNRQFDEEARARAQRRLSEEPRTEKAVRRDQTHALSCKCCECKRKIKETEVLMRDTELHRKPRNEEDDRRRRRSFEDEQAPRLRETQQRRDVRDEKWKQQDAMAMAAARQQRRQSTKPEEASAPKRTPSGGRRGCECKPKNRRVVASEPVDMDEQPKTSSNSVADSSEKQSCCCFRRKKMQPKRADVNDKGCSKSCRCKEEPIAAAQSRKHDKRNDNELNVSEPKSTPKKRRNSEQAASSSKETDCQTPCNCKKPKGVPLTKCCKCSEEMVHAMARERDEDTKRRELAEELAERLQKRAELQIALQKRLQQQKSDKQSQQGCCCCCCEQPPFCMPTCTCCESMKQAEPIPLGCYEAPPCCCPPTPCCFQTPACCYEAPPCYGQECPCCCQPMPYSYSASCSYPKPGAC